MTAAQPWGTDAGSVQTGPYERRGRGRRVTVAVLAAAALGAVALGLVVGQVWRLIAPRLPVVKVEGGYRYVGDAQSEQPVAADGWFGLLGLIAGILAAVLAWWLLRHRRGVAVLAMLVLGSLVGGWLGWWVAARLERASFEEHYAATPIGGGLEAPLSLNLTDLNRADPWPFHLSERISVRVSGVVAAQALAVAFTYTVLAGFAVDPDLRPNPPEPLMEDELGEPDRTTDPASPLPATDPAPPVRAVYRMPPGRATDPTRAADPTRATDSTRAGAPFSSAPDGPAGPTAAPEPPSPGATG